MGGEQKGWMSKTGRSVHLWRSSDGTQFTGGPGTALAPSSVTYSHAPASTHQVGASASLLQVQRPSSQTPSPESGESGLNTSPSGPAVHRKQDLGQSSEGQVLRLFLCEALRKVPSKRCL